jgi:hypothetical protein
LWFALAAYLLLFRLQALRLALWFCESSLAFLSLSLIISYLYYLYLFIFLLSHACLFESVRLVRIQQSEVLWLETPFVRSLQVHSLP